MKNLRCTNVRALVVTAALMGSVLPHAYGHEMQLQDYGYWSYYQFTHEGEPTCSVTQDKWRQILRACYVSHDAEGQLLATAKQEGLLNGRFFSCNAQLRFTAADGSRLGTLTGSLWVLYGGAFEVKNAEGETVARVTLDNHAQFAAVRSPANWNLVLGYASRVQQATRGKDSWLLSPPGDAVAIDARVWPLIMAFIGDRWGRIASQHDEG